MKRFENSIEIFSCLFCYVCATQRWSIDTVSDFWHHGHFMANFGIVLSYKMICFRVFISFFLSSVYRLKICQHHHFGNGTNTLSQLLGRSIRFVTLLFVVGVYFWILKHVPQLKRKKPHMLWKRYIDTHNRDKWHSFEMLHRLFWIRCGTNWHLWFDCLFLSWRITSFSYLSFVLMEYNSILCWLFIRKDERTNCKEIQFQFIKHKSTFNCFKTFHSAK